VKLASSDPLCWFDRTSYLDRLAHWALGHRDHLIQAAAALRDHPQQERSRGPARLTRECLRGRISNCRAVRNRA
jgi:hypothetical protein